MNENKETCKLLLEDYQLILRNEIYSVIDRNPTDEETALFETYAHDYIADCLHAGTRPDFAGLCLSLYECRKENFKQCTACGDWYLMTELDDWNYCPQTQCRIEEQEERNFNPRREWGTY